MNFKDNIGLVVNAWDEAMVEHMRRRILGVIDPELDAQLQKEYEESQKADKKAREDKEREERRAMMKKTKSQLIKEIEELEEKLSEQYYD